MITKRLDGTFVIDHNGAPYHVVPKSVDPHNAYDFDELSEYAEAHPEEVQDEQAPDPRPGRIAELEKYLASTDWYIIRKLDTGAPAPAEVLEARQAARDEISLLREGV